MGTRKLSANYYCYSYQRAMPLFIRLNPRSCNASKRHQLSQLMNIISNLIFHCNNCDANTVFVTTGKSTADAPSSSLLNAKCTFKETSPPIILAQIVRPINVIQLCC